MNICCAVSNKEGELEYFSNGFYALTTSLDEKFTEGKSGYVKKTTRTSRLTTLLDDTKFKDRKIDFLTVDAEGHDLEVLESLDFERYAPSLVAVEAHQPLFKELCETPLYKFFETKGYCLVGWCGLTILMAAPSLQETLTNPDS